MWRLLALIAVSASSLARPQGYPPPSQTFQGGSQQYGQQDLRAEASSFNERMDPIESLGTNIPGRGIPGEDYPILVSVPETGFACEDQEFPGYYADTADEAGCQVFHICQEDFRQDSFLCPNGTIFNQQYFICDWWFNVDCATSSDFFGLNADIGVVPDTQGGWPTPRPPRGTPRSRTSTDVLLTRTSSLPDDVPASTSVPSHHLGQPPSVPSDYPEESLSLRSSEDTIIKMKSKNISPPFLKMQFSSLHKMPETPELLSSQHPHFPSILMTQVPAPPITKSTAQRKTSNSPNQFQHRFLNVQDDMNIATNLSSELSKDSDSNSSHHWESLKQNAKNNPMLINKSIRKLNRVHTQRNNNSRKVHVKSQVNEKSMNSQTNTFPSISMHPSSVKDIKSGGKTKSNDEILDLDKKIQYMEDIMKSLMKIQMDSMFNSHYFVGIGTPSPPTKTRTSGPNAAVSTNVPHQISRKPNLNIRNRRPFKLILGSSSVQNSNSYPSTDSISNFPSHNPHTTPISGKTNSDRINNENDSSDTISVTETYPNVSDSITNSYYTSIEDDLFSGTDSPLSNVNEPIITRDMSLESDQQSNDSDAISHHLLDLSSEKDDLQKSIDKKQSIFPFHPRIRDGGATPSTPLPHPSHPNLPRPHQHPQAQKLEKSFTSSLSSELPAGIRNSLLLEHRLRLRLYLLTALNQARLNLR